MKRYLIILVILSAMLPTTVARADVVVGDVDGLVYAVNDANLGGDRTIVLQSGSYFLNGAYLRITADNVAIRSESGNRADVVLDGQYITTEIFQILASHVTIKDMTLKRAVYHPIHVTGASDRPITGTIIQHVHIIDPGQQAVKINRSGNGFSADDGLISDSLIELTDAGRTKVWEINGSCYTGGIDAHGAANWIIRDNTVAGFWCAADLSEHGIHFWSAAAGTLVERNRIIDCDRGIGFGLGSSPHHGGIIRNNMIYHPGSHGYSDVGIGLESADNARVYNNTIILDHDYANAIEYRFVSSTGIIIANNLVNKGITSREGGTASLYNNVTDAAADWFVDAKAGDLHLESAVTGVVNAAAPITGLTDDYDRGERPYNGGIDIGADEFGSPPVVTRAKAMPWLFLLF